MKQLKIKILLCLLICLAITPVYAATFDGSKSLICAVSEVVDCGRHEGCEVAYPEDVNLPTFIRIDFKKKEMKGGERDTKIDSVVSTDTSVIMQGKGIEGRSWTVNLNKETGKLTGGVVGEEFVFAVFGECIVP